MASPGGLRSSTGRSGSKIPISSNLHRLSTLGAGAGRAGPWRPAARFGFCARCCESRLTRLVRSALVRFGGGALVFGVAIVVEVFVTWDGFELERADDGMVFVVSD